MPEVHTLASLEQYRVSKPFLNPKGIADLRMGSAVIRHVWLVIDYCDGNLAWAAQELGIHRTSLWRIISGKTRYTRKKRKRPERTSGPSTA